jgi:hypothetical protein
VTREGSDALCPKRVAGILLAEYSVTMACLLLWLSPVFTFHPVITAVASLCHSFHIMALTTRGKGKDIQAECELLRLRSDVLVINMQNTPLFLSLSILLPVISGFSRGENEILALFFFFFFNGSLDSYLSIFQDNLYLRGVVDP